MFEGLKLIWEEELYGNSKYYYKRGLIIEDDLKTLKAWLDTTVVPFKGFSGKLFFHKTTQFPRYKFTEYSRNNNKLVRRVRDIDNSDAVIIDVDTHINNVNNMLNSIKNYTIINNAHNLPQHTQTGEPCYVKDDSGLTKGNVTRGEFSNSHINIDFLCWLYNNWTKKNFKIISVYDLNQNLGKQYEAVNASKSEQLGRLFQSKSNDDIKLAMEVMTNCDLEASYFHVALLFGKYGNAMRNISYWNSTSFKAFRSNVDNLGLNCESLIRMQTLDIVEEYFTLENKFIFEEDIHFVKALIKEDVEKSYNFETTGFKLNNYEIELKIDPTKIIKHVVENVSDSTDSDVSNISNVSVGESSKCTVG